MADYTCPMHPEVRKADPGNCPKCGMALEAATVAMPTSRTEYLVGERLAHALQLGHALEGEEERDARAARRLEHLRKPGISEGRELVQDHRKHWFVGIPVAGWLRVAFAHHQLDVLEQDLPQGFDRALIAIGVEGDEQDEIPFENVVERQQVLVGAGHDRQLILQEAQQLIQKPLNLLDTLAVRE